MRRAAAALCALVAGAAVPGVTAPLRGGLCILPAQVDAIAARPRDRDAARDLPVRGYMLALSWSPEFCAREGGRDKMQCRDNNFGFVVHGLWPQGEGQRHPRHCAPASAIDVATVRRNLCMMPSRSLIAGQWAAHGTCGWRDPAAYFAKTADLYRALRLPDPARLTSVGALKNAVVALNPGLPRAAVSVDRTRGGRFEELRICYGRNFAYRACTKAERGAPDRAPLIVTAVAR